MIRQEFLDLYATMQAERGIDATKAMRVDQAEKWFRRFGKDDSAALRSAFDDCGKTAGTLKTSDFFEALSRARKRRLYERERERREADLRECEEAPLEEQRRVQAALFVWRDLASKGYSLSQQVEVALRVVQGRAPVYPPEPDKSGRI